MPETTRAQCPGCAANLADDGHSDVLTCAYCGTRVTVNRPHTPPRPPAPRVRTERDALLERLGAEERDWDARIRAAERPGGADIALPLLAGAAVMFALFLVLLPLDRALEKHPLYPLAGCSFWLSGPIAAIVVHRILSRRRERRAKGIAAHRDEALAPLRARIARLDAKPEALTEKQRRIRTLEAERDEARRRLDLAYHLVEEARTSGLADLFVIPAAGCGVWVLLMGVGGTILSNRPAEQITPAEGIVFILGPLVVFVLMVVVPLIWRPLRRRRRVAQLEKERDRNAPKLQQRLNEIESELARLTRP